VLVVVVAAGISVVAPLPAMDRAFMLGFLTASFLACCCRMVFVLVESFAGRLSRRSAQETIQAVTGARRRRRGWRLVNGTFRGGGGATDHVLVGPGGVFVIESRWTTNICEVDDGTIAGVFGREPVSQAQDAAHRVERMLHYASHGFDVIVQPVIVVWGPGGLALDEGWTKVDGVLVCEGRKKELWLGQLDGSELDQSAVPRVTNALARQVADQVQSAELTFSH
jgi:hypothetical protein